MNDKTKPVRVAPQALGSLAGVHAIEEIDELIEREDRALAEGAREASAETEAIAQAAARAGIGQGDPRRATEEVAPAGMKRVRKPFGAREPRGMWPKIPGFQIRWINNSPGRVERAMAAGYAHVTTRDGRPYTLTVGQAEYGGGLAGYLMKIPDEFYNEDYAAKQQLLSEGDAQIMRGRFKDAGNKDQRSYIPRSGMRIAANKEPR